MRWKDDAFLLVLSFLWHFALWNRAHSSSSYISHISHIKSAQLHSFIHFQLLGQGLDVHCALRVQEPYNYLASYSGLSWFLSSSPPFPLAVVPRFPPCKVNPAFNREPVTATLLPLSANTIHTTCSLIRESKAWDSLYPSRISQESSLVVKWKSRKKKFISHWFHRF